jgi:antitoxin HicB
MSRYALIRAILSTASEQNAMRKLEYPITLRPLARDGGGGWLAEFPDLPGCMADGATPEEAMREAADAARSWIKTAKAHGDPIPTPSRADRSSCSERTANEW